MSTHSGSNRGLAGGLRIAMVLGLIVLVFGVPAMAAAVPPEPTLGSAIVDGNPGEWDLTADFFAEMHRAAKPAFPLEAKLYLRYSCATETLYALVLTEPGVVLDTAGDQFAKLSGETKIMDKAFPSFAYVMSGSDAVGWEASAALVPGSYTDLNVHAQVLDGGSNTSAVDGRAIPLTIVCDPSAVTLAGLSAQSSASFPLAGAALLVVGMVGAGVVAWRRQR